MKYKLIIIIIIISFFIVFTSLLSCKNKEQTDTFPQIECDSINTLPKYDSKLVTLLDNDGKPIKDTIIEKIKKNLSIYIPCEKYVFKAKFYNQKGNLLSNSQVLLMSIGEKWEYDAMQDAAFMAYKYSVKEKKGITRYFEKKGYPLTGWWREEKTGLIENTEQVWLHPFRGNQYTLTEIAPFPSVKLPIAIGNKWYSSLRIEQGWGIWSNKTGNSSYEVVSKENLHLGFSKTKVSCYKIKAKSNFDFGTSYVTLYYSEKYGFIKEIYQFYNGEKLEFELIDIR